MSTIVIMMITGFIIITDRHVLMRICCLLSYQPVVTTTDDVHQASASRKWKYKSPTHSLLQLEHQHYNDVIMTTIASQITSLTVVYSIVYSDADQRKHQSSASLAFVRGIHRDRWIPRTKGQLRGKCFHLMTSSWNYVCVIHIIFKYHFFECYASGPVLLTWIDISWGIWNTFYPL